jgi:hypothetical protein
MADAWWNGCVGTATATVPSGRSAGTSAVGVRVTPAGRRSSPDRAVPGPGIFHRAYRRTTAGLLMLVTFAAFEAMAVGTAMPTAVAEFDGLAVQLADATMPALCIGLAGVLVAAATAGSVTLPVPLTASIAVFTALAVLGARLARRAAAPPEGAVPAAATTLAAS